MLVWNNTESALCKGFILFIKVNNFAKTESISIKKNKQNMLIFSFILNMFNLHNFIQFLSTNIPQDWKSRTEIKTRFYLAPIGILVPCLIWV